MLLKFWCQKSRRGNKVFQMQTWNQQHVRLHLCGLTTAWGSKIRWQQSIWHLNQIWNTIFWCTQKCKGTVTNVTVTNVTVPLHYYSFFSEWIIDYFIWNFLPQILLYLSFLMAKATITTKDLDCLGFTIIRATAPPFAAHYLCVCACNPRTALSIFSDWLKVVAQVPGWETNCV